MYNWWLSVASLRVTEGSSVVGVCLGQHWSRMPYYFSGCCDKMPDKSNLQISVYFGPQCAGVAHPRAWHQSRAGRWGSGWGPAARLLGWRFVPRCPLWDVYSVQVPHSLGCCCPFSMVLPSSSHALTGTPRMSLSHSKPSEEDTED